MDRSADLSFAPSATSSQNTFNQYFSIVNKAGGVNGHPLQLVTKDTGGDPTVALQAVRDYIGQGIKVFFVQTYAEESALQPLMDGSIITFTTNPPAPLNDPKVYPYNINWFPPNKYAIFKDSQYLKKLGVTKVALVTNTTAQFQEYIDAAHQLLPPNGIQIVLEQRYDPTTTDFSSIITKIQQSGGAGGDRLLVRQRGDELLQRRGGREPPDTASRRVRNAASTSRRSRSTT